MPPSPRADQALDASTVRAWPLPADESDAKTGRGTVLVVGGSVETPGAAVLAGLAALRVGAGRLQIATAPEVAPSVAVDVPEARVVADTSAALEAVVRDASAVLIGPGCLDPARTAELLELVLAAATGAVVVDAGALDALAQRTSYGAAGGGPVVLTANTDELATLASAVPPDADVERAVAAGYGATVVTFGRVATPSGSAWCAGGSVPGLGTSGSGDVLAGAIAGLAARGAAGPQAACWGVVLHRVAGQRLAERVAPTGYLAREIVHELASAYAAVSSAKD